MYVPPDVRLNLEKAVPMFLITKASDERACGYDLKLSKARQQMTDIIDRLLDEVILYNQEEQESGA